MPDNDPDNDEDEDDEQFYTPDTSPRLSLISNSSSAFGSAGGGGRRTPVTSRPASQRSSRVLLSNGNLIPLHQRGPNLRNRGLTHANAHLSHMKHAS